MQAILRILFTTFLLLIIAGCSTTQQTIVAEYDSNIDYQYPEVSIYYDSPTKESLLKCKLFEIKFGDNKCHINGVKTEFYKDEFTNSALFNDVYFANNDTEYSIAIATTGQESNHNNPQKQTITAEVGVYWQNFNIKNYYYELPYVYSNTKLSLKYRDDKTFAQSLVSHIIADIQHDKIFSNTFLPKLLNASDYVEDLSVPTAINNFQYNGQFLYNNPLLGSVINYANPDFHDDNIDLYVYPIRHVNVTNHQMLLSQESENIKTEFTSAAEKYEWTLLNFSTNKQLDIQTDKNAIQGVYFEGDYLEKFGEKNFTTFYLFKVKDKFVKFRASFPAKYITEHIKEIIEQIDVPDESIFMKNLRRKSQQRMLAKNKENS